MPTRARGRPREKPGSRAPDSRLARTAPPRHEAPVATTDGIPATDRRRADASTCSRKRRRASVGRRWRREMAAGPRRARATVTRLSRRTRRAGPRGGNVAWIAKCRAQMPSKLHAMPGVLRERVQEHRARRALERERVPIGSGPLIEFRPEPLDADPALEETVQPREHLRAHVRAAPLPLLALRSRLRVGGPLFPQQPPRFGLEVGARTCRHHVRGSRR